MRRRCGWRASSAGRVDAGKGDVGRRELLLQRVGVERAEHGGDLAVGLGAAFDALDIGGEIGIGGERGIAQDFFRQHAPFAVALDRDQDVDAVAALERAVGRDRGVGEAHALRRLAGFLLQQRHRHPIRHGVEHGNRKLGAFAGALPRDQSFEDRLLGIHAGADIDDGHADARRLRRAGDRGEARLRLDQHVVGLAHGVRPALAVAGDRAADQPRMLAAQFRDRESELCHRAGFQVLHEHVGAREHRRQQRLVLGLVRSSTTDSLPRLSQTK